MRTTLGEWWGGRRWVLVLAVAVSGTLLSVRAATTDCDYDGLTDSPS